MWRWGSTASQPFEGRGAVLGAWQRGWEEAEAGASRLGYTGEPGTVTLPCAYQVIHGWCDPIVLVDCVYHLQSIHLLLYPSLIHLLINSGNNYRIL